MFRNKIASIVCIVHIFLFLIVNVVYASNEENAETKSTLIDIFKRRPGTLNCFGIPSIFANAIEHLFSDTTKAQDVRFYFYSRDQAGNITIHANDNFKLTNINYKTNRDTIVIVHGFMSSGQEDWVRDMKDAFLKLHDFNVIIVDWQRGSNTWNYYQASISTRIVGFQIAKILTEIGLQTLQQSPKAKNLGSLHFVGHSLGSHISARAAYLLQASQMNKTSKWIVRRITGLDPAQPCFSTTDLSFKLDKNDALFVDVIHTNGRHILFLGLGFPHQLGDLDFYPNGGQVQLGCDSINTDLWRFLTLPSNIIKTAICSHGRSYELFTDSILVKVSGNCTYVGHKWDKTYTNMNELLTTDCNESICPEEGINSINYYPAYTGTYFVPTASTPHYCGVTKASLLEMEQQLLRDEKAANNIIIELADNVFG